MQINVAAIIIIVTAIIIGVGASYLLPPSTEKYYIELEKGCEIIEEELENVN